MTKHQLKKAKNLSDMSLTDACACFTHRVSGIQDYITSISNSKLLLIIFIQVVEYLHKIK